LSIVNTIALKPVHCNIDIIHDIVLCHFAACTSVNCRTGYCPCRAKLHPHLVKLYRVGCVGSGFALLNNNIIYILKAVNDNIPVFVLFLCVTHSNGLTRLKCVTFETRQRSYSTDCRITETKYNYRHLSACSEIWSLYLGIGSKIVGDKDYRPTFSEIVFSSFSLCSSSLVWACFTFPCTNRAQ